MQTSLQVERAARHIHLSDLVIGVLCVAAILALVILGGCDEPPVLYPDAVNGAAVEAFVELDTPKGPARINLTTGAHLGSGGESISVSSWGIRTVVIIGGRLVAVSFGPDGVEGIEIRPFREADEAAEDADVGPMALPMGGF